MKDYNFWVYILFDKRASGTYIGVTNNLERRMYEHKMGLDDGFTKERNVHKLGYFEYYKYIDNAIAREKQLKKWKRAWKYRLIETMNPNWNDLADGLSKNIEYWKNKETVQTLFLPSQEGQNTPTIGMTKHAYDRHDKGGSWVAKITGLPHFVRDDKLVFNKKLYICNIDC